MSRPVGDARAQFAAAIAALNAGRLEAADAIVSELAAEMPDAPAVQHLRAAIALRMGRLDEAERWVQSLVALVPAHAPAWAQAGDVARARGEGGLAIERLARAVELDPERPETAFALAALRLDRATETSVRRAIVTDLSARFADFAVGWGPIAQQLAQREEPTLALVALHHAEDSSVNLMLQGDLLARAGRQAQAATAFRAVVEREPQAAAAWFRLGLALQDGRDPQGAIDAYREALRLRPDLAEAEVNLGIVLQETGDIDGAKSAYGRAIRLRPDTFGRIVQAMSAAPKGELWLDHQALRAHLTALDG